MRYYNYRVDTSSPDGLRVTPGDEANGREIVASSQAFQQHGEDLTRGLGVELVHTDSI